MSYFIPLSIFHGKPRPCKLKLLPAVLVLEVLQLCVDLLNVKLRPQDVAVAGHAVDHAVVQAVEFGEQRELPLDPLQLRILCRKQREVRWGGRRQRKEEAELSRTINGKSEELLPSRAGGVLPPQLIELRLETLQPLAGLSRSHALHAGAPAHTHPRTISFSPGVRLHPHRLITAACSPEVVLSAEALKLQLEALDCGQQVGLHAGLDPHQKVLVLHHL